VAEQHTESAYGRTPAEKHTIEVVGWFADRESFRKAVEALRAEGFARSDLSVLDTHESISAADSPREVLAETISGLVREVNYIGPLAAAGIIAVSAGPVGALISAALGTGVAGYAVRDLLSELRATPHTEEFARAAENGAILLWVRAEDQGAQDTAIRVLREHGGGDVHTHERPRHPAEGASGGDARA
jgi:hypothetical protein